MAAEPAISSSQYRKHFLTEQSCHAYMFKMKWPEGFRCSKCRNDSCYEITTRHYPLYECKKCGCQEALTVGTIFEKTRIPITVWFAAIYCIVRNEHVSTASIARRLEINYQTAWAMARKIRKALANPHCVASAPKFEEDELLS